MEEMRDRDVAVESETLAAAVDPSEQFAQVATEAAELKDLLQRRQADFENFRRRAERERLETFEAATMETVRSLLPVLDDFDRALQSSPAEGPVRDYAKGVELIYQRLYDGMAKLGLEPIETLGHMFDPNLHHAVQKMETTDAPEDSVIEEFQRGYRFKGKLLRPAMVKVAVKAG